MKDEKREEAGDGGRVGGTRMSPRLAPPARDGWATRMGFGFLVYGFWLLVIWTIRSGATYDIPHTTYPLQEAVQMVERSRSDG